MNRPSTESSWPLARPLALALPMLFAGHAAAQGTPLGFEETFALAADRTKALADLIPGSPEHYFYACLNGQNDGRLAEVDELLAAWRKRHGGSAQLDRLEARQAFLRFRTDAAGTYAYVVRRLGLGFNQSQVIPGAATHLPTRLDPAQVTSESWLRSALSRRSNGVGDLEDRMLERITARDLTDEQVSDLVPRLRRPDVPGLVPLLVRELGFEKSRGFGAHTIHQNLLLAQLEELLGALPKLLSDQRFVETYLPRLAPSADEDASDLAVRAAHLERLERFTARLAPAFDGLKAHVQYHRLVLDLERGPLDAGRVLAYLRVARQGQYVDPDYARGKSSIDLSGAWSTGLPSIGSDEPIVREYLSKLFVEADSYDRFVGTLRGEYVKRLFAEAKILSGAPDMERWYSLLDDPAYYEQLKERVEIEFPRGQRRQFAPSEPVTIDVDVKNVETLLVKVFEIDTLGYFEAQQRSGRMRDIDASIDLDGLIAHEEATHTLDAPPLRRMRRSFEFPRLAKPGVYVVEFIGNGVSSRAVIRKGGLSAIERVGAAGSVFRILDEAGQHVPDAAIRFAGREYTANERGDVTIPFSTDPGRRQVILRRGDLGVLDEFTHVAESYALEAGIHIEREALIAGERAQIVVRPRLTVAGERIRLSLLEEPTLELVATDIDGVATTSTVRGITLLDEREAVHEILVPARTVHLTVALAGHVASVSEAKDVALRSGTASFSINGIDATDEVLSPLLTHTAEGYVVEVRGKNGEAAAGRSCVVDVKHRNFRSTRGYSLQTDEHGRLELGPLTGIERVQVSGIGGEASAWHLAEPLRSGAASEVHALEGETLRIPYEGSATALNATNLSLLELRAGQYAFDRIEQVKLANGYIELSGLPAGDYRLEIEETQQAFDVRVARGQRVAGRSLGAARRLELSRPIDLAIARAAVEGDDLVVRLAGAGPKARVHVTATRYVPAIDPHNSLALARRFGLLRETVVATDSSYESGRRISDEYRYILERRFAARFPGNMLARAGVLLNPWAIDESTDDTLAGAGAEGGRFRGRRGERPSASMAEGKSERRAHSGRSQSFANLDFLADAASVTLNLAPDAQGIVRVPLASLGEHHVVRVVAVDDDFTLSRTVLLGEKAAALRDRTLATTLDPAKHFVEERRLELLDAGASITLTDAANSGVETYDSLDDVFRLYTTRSGDAELAKFEFLLRWPKLSRDERLAKYSEFACHELHVFLRERDPEFFQSVVQPYLAHKADKTFLDHWLLGGDLARYFEPWTFAQLNTFERILLLRGQGAEAPRHVRELVELLPPETFALRTYFDSVMAGSALDADKGALGLALLERAKETEELARKSLGDRRALRSDAAAAPSGPASPGPTTAGRPSGGAAPGRDAAREAGEAGADEFFLGAQVQELGESLNELEADRQGSELQDLVTRQQQRSFFRALPDTAELAERNYWRVLIQAHDASLITPTPFWLDFAESAPSAPFVSEHFPLATRNSTEMLLALALLDLPFEASEHRTESDERGIVFTAGSRLLLARKGLAEVRAQDDASPILIGQDFFRLDEPFVYENGKQRDRFVSGEFLKGVPYGCRVVVTNPTSTPVDIEVLLQIPEGALPVRRGFMTKGLAASLGGYGSQSIEYAFYFPTAGVFRHYPAHVGEDGALLAFAPATTLGVVDAPTVIDTTSWEHVSQMGDNDAVLRYLAAANLARTDLSRIAWRMKDKAMFDRTLGLLRGRFVFDETLWSFGLLHKDERTAREYLERREDLVDLCGPWLQTPLLSVDATARRRYQHLEYDPLVNGRAHRFGPERRILNSSFAGQYQSFLALLAYKPALDDEDRLALTYYLSLQDRVEEALATFAKVKASGLESRLQYDYMRAYLAFYSPEPGAARAIAAAYVDHPVERWRARFRDVVQQLDEAEGKGVAGVTDPTSRDQQQTALAATEPSLELAVEARRVTLTYANVKEAEVRYRPMDIELLFSTNPFLQSGSSSFASIKPNRVQVVALPAGQDVLSFDLPAEFQGANVLVEVRAGGVVRSNAYYANDLRVQGLENYGQIAVRRASDGAPLPAAYVKVYARLANGQVRFHKDGYTDLRGRFDYVSLSGMDGAQVARYAVLVMSEQQGAVVREFAPPQQ